jgi:Ca2+-binding EF-hand superfamily protein
MKTKDNPYTHCHRFATVVIVAASCVSACKAEPASAGSDGLFERLDGDGNGTIAASEIQPDHKRLFERLLRNADINGDKSLSRDEFLAALLPSRPEKQIETKLSANYPQAAAVRYLLLTMDTGKDSSIETDEVPEDMLPVYEDMVERLDMNKNGSMDRYELARGARELGQLAARYVARERIDVAKELKKFDQSQGEQAQRFDRAPGPLLANLGNPGQARKVFKQLDVDSDGKLVLEELPDPLQPQFERLMRLADRDRDGGLSEREFFVAAERISRVMSGQRPKSPNDERRRAQLKPADLAPTESSDESMPAEEMPTEEP